MADALTRLDEESGELEKTRPWIPVCNRLPIHIRPLGKEGFELALLVDGRAIQAVLRAAEESHSDRGKRYRLICEAVIASLDSPSLAEDQNIGIACGNGK